VRGARQPGWVVTFTFPKESSAVEINQISGNDVNDVIADLASQLRAVGRRSLILVVSLNTDPAQLPS
jgi:hypothetical protein